MQVAVHAKGMLENKLDVFRFQSFFSSTLDSSSVFQLWVDSVVACNDLSIVLGGLIRG
jgi:hypothetical protein